MTLDQLALALRGMPRDARILIKLNNGQLVDIDHITAAYIGDGNRAHNGPSGGGQYGIILVSSQLDDRSEK
jgi:hypothetical protein